MYVFIKPTNYSGIIACIPDISGLIIIDSTEHQDNLKEIDDDNGHGREN
jgi:hypothetical protein